MSFFTPRFPSLLRGERQLVVRYLDMPVETIFTHALGSGNAAAHAAEHGRAILPRMVGHANGVDGA